MAITTKEVYYDSEKVLNAPAGNAIPTAAVADLSAASISERVDVEVAVTGNTNANPITAFDAILNALIKAVLDAKMAAISPGYGLDLTNTVQYQAKVVAIKRNATAGAVTDIFLVEASVKFIVTVDLIIKIS